MSVWESIQYAGTPLTLIAFLVAVAALAYRRILSSRIDAITAAPEDARGALVDKLLESYSISKDNLTRQQKFELMREVLAGKAARFRIAAIVAVVFAMLLAIVLVVSILAANDQPQPMPDAGRQRPVALTVSIREVDMVTPSRKPATTRTFTGDDSDVIAQEAAVWIGATLDELFPRADSSLIVKAAVDPVSHTLNIIPADTYRRDHLWMFEMIEDFAAPPMKTGHPRIAEAREATREAIEKALVAGDADRGILVHFDRPGYDLELREIPLDGSEVAVELKRREAPAWTVIVDEIKGNDVLAERLRAELSSLGVNVGTPQLFDELKSIYKESREPRLGPGQRLVKLRQSRVDALVTGAVWDIISRP